MWPLRMTDICVKIYRCHLLYAREYWFAVAVVVAAVIVLTYLHKWCQVIIGLGLPGTIPQFRHNWFKTQGYFTIKQNETNILSSTIYLKKKTRIRNTTQSVCEPLSEPMMIRCVLKVPKFNHDIFGKRPFAVCRPLSWNLGYAMKLKHSSEP